MWSFFSSSYNEHSHNLFFKTLFFFYLNNSLNNLITQVPVFQCQQKQRPGNMWPDIAIYCHSRDLPFQHSIDQIQITVTLYFKAQLVNTVNPTIRLLPLNQKMMQLNDAETWSAMNSLCQFKFVQKPNVFGTLTLYQQALCWIRYHLSFLQLASSQHKHGVACSS